MCDATPTPEEVQECIRIVDELLCIVPDRKEMQRAQRHLCGYFESKENTRILDWEKYNELINSLRLLFKKSFGHELQDSCTLKTEVDGEQILIRERPWRPCIQGLRDFLSFELRLAMGDYSA